MAGRSQWVRLVHDLAAEVDATVDVTGGSHLRLRLPGGASVFAAGTPRNQWREAKNVRAQLRRAKRQAGT